MGRSVRSLRGARKVLQKSRRLFPQVAVEGRKGCYRRLMSGQSCRVWWESPVGDAGFSRGVGGISFCAGNGLSLHTRHIVCKRLLLATQQQILLIRWPATHDLDALLHLQYVLRKWDLPLKNDFSVQAPHLDPRVRQASSCDKRECCGSQQAPGLLRRDQSAICRSVVIQCEFLV